MNSPESAVAAADTPTGKRKRGLLLLAAVVLIAGVAWFAWWYTHARWYVSTEDAYAGATIVQVTSEIAGTVRTVHPRETESVTAGQPLIELDPADARIAMEAAVADLGATVRQVRGTYPQTGRLQAQISARETDLARARDDLRRRQSIAGGGAVSTEELAHAREVVAGAEASLRSAREDLNVALAQTGGIEASRHPLVMRAVAKVREAALALERTRITAPVNGVVARKGVQLGQRVNAGTPLLAIVELDDAWVDANFKEVQLQRMRIGQPVELSRTSTATTWSITDASRASRPEPAPHSRCCQRRTRRATGSRSCSACLYASSSTRKRSPSTRCGSGCRCTRRSTCMTRAARCWPNRPARSRRPWPTGQNATSRSKP